MIFNFDNALYKKNYISLYNNDRNHYSAEAIIQCYFQSGLKHLIPNTPCVIAANNENLQIITTDSSKITVKINYSRILEFKYLKEIPGFLDYGVGARINLNDGFYVIRYGTKESHVDMFFVVPTIADAEKSMYNKYSLKRVDIVSYINNKLPQRSDIIIEL